MVSVSGHEVRIEAERHLELGVGTSRVALRRDGRLSVLGKRLTMHVASLIKLIASKVELP